MSLRFVWKDVIDSKLTLFKVESWKLLGSKLLPATRMIQFTDK